MVRLVVLYGRSLTQEAPMMLYRPEGGAKHSKALRPGKRCDDER
jgi:hypothetical protein